MESGGSVSERRDELELRFEKALVEVLAHEHDLEVRHREDHIDRRRQGVATLNFTFHYGKDGENAKVVITVDGADKFSNVLPVDFRNRKGIEGSAENCEALVHFLRDHLAECREKELADASQSQLKYSRRDDDLA